MSNINKCFGITNISNSFSNITNSFNNITKKLLQCNVTISFNNILIHFVILLIHLIIHVLLILKISNITTWISIIIDILVCNIKTCVLYI